MKVFLFTLILFQVSTFAGQIEIKNTLCRNFSEDISIEIYEKVYSESFRKEFNVEKNNSFFKGLKEDFGKCVSSEVTKLDQDRFNATIYTDSVRVIFRVHINKNYKITGLWVEKISTISNTLEEKIAYICTLLNGKEEINYKENFHASFREAIPLEKIKGIFDHIFKEYGKCRDVEVSITSRSSADFLTLHSKKLKFTINIDTKSSLITGLLYKGEEIEEIQIESIKDLDNHLKSLPGKSQFLFKEMGGKVLFKKNSQGPFPLGSAFKLYILLALQEKINENEAKWTDLLEIKDKLKSLPSGEMQNLKEGEKRELFFFARKMIEVSDNTATDHLLEYVGRENVENILKRLGVDHSGNKPFLSTMDMFRTRAFFSKNDVKNFIQANRKERLLKLELLKTKSDSEFITGLKKWGNNPLYIREIEWFSSANEMCKLYEELDRVKSENIRKILSYNTPFVTKDIASYAGYKGGSEPGVLAMTYILEKGSKKYCFIAAQNNSKESIKEGHFFSLIEGALKYFLKTK